MKEYIPRVGDLILGAVNKSGNYRFTGFILKIIDESKNDVSIYWTIWKINKDLPLCPSGESEGYSYTGNEYLTVPSKCRDFLPGLDYRERDSWENSADVNDKKL